MIQIIEGTEKILIDSVSDDLVIVLEEILTTGRPSQNSLDQVEYNKERLENAIPVCSDDTYAHNMSDLLRTTELILEKYGDGDGT